MNVSRYNRAVGLGKISILLALINVVLIVCFMMGWSDMAVLFSFVLTPIIIVLSGISIALARTGIALFVFIVHTLLLIGFGVLGYLFRRSFCVIC